MTFSNCNVCGRELARDDELAIGVCAVCANEETPARQHEGTERAKAMQVYENPYHQGFADGVACFAWWKDGVQYVGTTGKTLGDALGQLWKLHNFNPSKSKLETQLEQVATSLLIAHRDLDAANTKLCNLKGRAVCLYCQKEFEYKTAAGQEALADHICSCDKNPMLRGCKEIATRFEEFYTLVESYLCTPNTNPAVKDHYDALVAWFVRNKRPDGTEPRPVSPDQEHFL